MREQMKLRMKCLTKQQLLAGLISCLFWTGLAKAQDTEDPTFMFVQTGQQGSFRSIDDASSGRYLLTLTNVSPSTVYFSDRPDRIAGTANNGKFIEGFNFGTADPPNAAVVFSTKGGTRQNIVVVELTKPRYQKEQRTLTYEARVLPSYDGETLSHWASKMQTHVPETFGQVSLFIDHCSSKEPSCYGAYQCSGDGEDCCRSNCGDLSKKASYCFSWEQLMCIPCHDHIEDCNAELCSGSDPLCLPDACDTLGPMCV